MWLPTARLRKPRKLLGGDTVTSRDQVLSVATMLGKVGLYGTSWNHQVEPNPSGEASENV